MHGLDLTQRPVGHCGALSCALRPPGYEHGRSWVRNDPSGPTRKIVGTFVTHSVTVSNVSADTGRGFRQGGESSLHSLHSIAPKARNYARRMRLDGARRGPKEYLLPPQISVPACGWLTGCASCAPGCASASAGRGYSALAVPCRGRYHLRCHDPEAIRLSVARTAETHLFRRSPFPPLAGKSTGVPGFGRGYAASR